MKQIPVHKWNSCRLLNLGLVIVMLGVVAAHSSADEIVYSNVQTQTNHAVISSNTIWDDLQIVGGGTLTELDMIVLNSDSSGPRGFTGMIEFRLFDNPNGGPVGTLLGRLPVGPIRRGNPTRRAYNGESEWLGRARHLSAGR